MIDSKLATAIILVMIGHILGWYTHNLQFVYDFWKNKPILSNVIFGIPCGIAYWYSTKLFMEVMGDLWSSRFLVFALSYLTFPVLTWFYLNESMFTQKTMICTFLAVLIIIVQYAYK